MQTYKIANLVAVIFIILVFCHFVAVALELLESQYFPSPPLCQMAAVSYEEAVNDH